MGNEMEKKFSEQLQMQRQKIKIKKRKKNSFLNIEKYERPIQEISQPKRGRRKKEPRDYQLLKRYDVVRIENTVN